MAEDFRALADPVRTLPDFPSYLIERFQFAQRAGLDTFLGKRNVSQSLGYADKITLREYRQRYMRGGIAGAIVDAYPDATWAGDLSLMEDDDPKKKTVFEEMFTAFAERLHLWNIFNRADKLSGLGQYSIILLGADGDLSSELPKGKGTPDGIIYLTPFSQEDAQLQSLDVEFTSSRYGQPFQYLIKRVTANSPEMTKPVHWTRIVHLAEHCLDDTIFGLPRLERPWNRLDDLDKVLGGGAEAFWQRANQGTQFDLDKDMDLDPAEKDKMQAQIDAWKHNIDRTIRTRGVKVNTLGSDVANFADPADAIITQIAGMIRIPKRILTGSEMGQLASGQDADNWDKQVAARQKKYAGPMIVRQLVDRLIAYNYITKPKQYAVKWAEADNLTATEKADGANKWALTNKNQGEVVFTSDEIRDEWYGMDPLTDEQKAAYTTTHPIKDPNAATGAVDQQGNPISGTGDGSGNVTNFPKAARA